MSPDQTFKIYRVFSRVFYTFLSEPRVKWKTIWNNWTWPRYVRVIWCNNSVRDRLFRSRVTVLISQLPDKQLITTHEGTCWQSPILRLICTTIVDWRPPLVPQRDSITHKVWRNSPKNSSGHKHIYTTGKYCCKLLGNKLSPRIKFDIYYLGVRK